MLLGGSNIMTLGQVLDDLLADPASVEDPRLGVGETPFEVGNNSGISILTAQIVRVLLVPSRVGTTC